ncbi:major capsid protein [Desulfovibrio sp. OttesenSCG-928-G11]|nr:major capsid protein [Desulfovibrio sp. OttesenSCG-928-G11]
MPLDYFDSRVLTGVITRRPPQPGLITQLFFTSRQPSATDKFELHVETIQRRIVPFVSNVEGASIVQGRSAEVLLAKAPRIRLKRPFAAEEVLRNTVGMTPYDSSVNPVEAAIAKQMQDFRDDIEYTVEFMCAQLACQGKLSVKDNVEGKVRTIYELDLDRNPDHSVDVSAAASKWNGANGLIRKNVQAWSLLIAAATGQGATDLILGTNVVDPFLEHKDVKDRLDNRNINVGQLTLSVQSLYLGRWMGLDVWTYPYSMTDRTGNTAPLVAADSVLLGTRGAGQDIEWGLPLDRKCSGPTTFFAKTYEEEDPSQVWALVESRPMPWTKNPDAFLAAKVIA